MKLIVKYFFAYILFILGGGGVIFDLDKYIFSW